jgi:HPt (histidine-containing phosphotransfer) domain-containing protein
MTTGESPKPAAAPAIDLPGLLQRLGIDHEDAVVLLGGFLRETPKVVARLQMALAVPDAREAERAAHDLKGTVAWISARHATDLTAELERLARAGETGSMSARLPEVVRELDRVFAEAREITAGRP